jgi:hypothetical protein
VVAQAPMKWVSQWCERLPPPHTHPHPHPHPPTHTLARCPPILHPHRRGAASGWAEVSELEWGRPGYEDRVRLLAAEPIDYVVGGFRSVCFFFKTFLVLYFISYDPMSSA